jgi:hypothetical protein
MQASKRRKSTTSDIDANASLIWRNRTSAPTPWSVHSVNKGIRISLNFLRLYHNKRKRYQKIRNYLQTQDDAAFKHLRPSSPTIMSTSSPISPPSSLSFWLRLSVHYHFHLHTPHAKMIVVSELPLALSASYSPLKPEPQTLDHPSEDINSPILEVLLQILDAYLD